MPVKKNDYPILEYDTEKSGIIRPNRSGRHEIPAKCLMTFFGEALEGFVAKHGAAEINHYGSEMRKFPIYKAVYKGAEVGLVQAVVGSASIAMMADLLIGYGAKELIACGSCGVLTEIPAGDVIVPVAALRDEGASYNYLPPSREISVDESVVGVIKSTLDEFRTPFVEAKTWSTDAFYRETPDMVTYRKEEGCAVVEMECATLAAVAKFRGVRFGQLLYSGDILTDFANYDERGWDKNLSAREKLFYLSLETLIRI
ncbi:MAG: nucleoside phosphorylase [Defluviitaleaceae bacterium]|nr:nucleoside phosphorylase [Defluviitaleaceae bacterium]